MAASMTIYEKEYASRETYVYFICGVASALFAYMGKDYYPVHPLDLPGKYTIASMISLVVSFVFGMARIQVFLKGSTISRKMMNTQDEITVLSNAWKDITENRATMAFNTITGKKFVSAEGIDKELNQKREKWAKRLKQLKKWQKWAKICLGVCHVFLVLGFIFLIISKVVA
jgi:hypothetical protein